jgi:ribokinase
MLLYSVLGARASHRSFLPFFCCFMTPDVKSLLVVGSANVDLVAGVDRLPAEGETVLGGSLTQFAGGKGANQAVAAARAGASVAFAGCVGGDAFGGWLSDGLAREGIDLALLRRTPDRPSGTALIAVDRGGRNQIVVIPGANAAVDEKQIESIDFGRHGTVVFQLEVPAASVWLGLRRAREAGCRTILNPAPAAEIPADVFPLIDVLVPNEHELRLLSGNAGSVADSAGALLARGVRTVVVTMGPAGAIAFGESGTIEVPAPAVEAVDTTGAGDAFTGVLAATLAGGSDLATAMKRAVCAASLSVLSPGAQASYPDAASIEAALTAG